MKSNSNGTLRLLIVLVFSLLLMKFNSDWSRGAGTLAMDRPAAVHTLTGDIRFHQKFHSRFLATDRDLVIYLPPGYDQDQSRRYPVLYMQDGQNLFDAATSFFVGAERHFDESAERLVASQAIKPLIIVGIYSTELERINDYTPTPAPGTYRGGRADLYGQMLVEEIKPLIDSTYRTLTSRSDTGLGGASLGGLVSVYLGLKYANVFGNLAVSSPACDWDNEMIVRYVQSFPRKSDQKIFLSVGKGEPERFVASTRALHDALTAKGWKDGRDLSYWEPLVNEHKAGAWRTGVDVLLKFLFPADAAE
jgi:predicted alpha/beta superfamily hydrolase